MAKAAKGKVLKPNIGGFSLKGVKRHPTSDGDWFQANIYKDGVLVGSVENSGMGGCNFYYWKEGYGHTLEDELARLAVEKLGEKKDAHEKADTVIGELLDLQDFAKWAKRRVKAGDCHPVRVYKLPTKDDNGEVLWYNDIRYLSFPNEAYYQKFKRVAPKEFDKWDEPDVF